jgi:hypothetical protein
MLADAVVPKTHEELGRPSIGSRVMRHVQRTLVQFDDAAITHPSDALSSLASFNNYSLPGLCPSHSVRDRLEQRGASPTGRRNR